MVNAMRLIPWITIALFALICVSPLGQEVYTSLRSGEQLSRSMGQIILLIYLPVVLLVALAEMAIRIFVLRRRKTRMES